MSVLVKNPMIVTGGGSQPNLQSKYIQIYNNGSTTYYPQSDNCDGYSQVDVYVDVQAQSNLGEKTLNPPTNGSYYPMYDNLDGYNHIIVSNGFTPIDTGLYGLSYYDGTENQQTLAKIIVSSGNTANLSSGVKYILPGACSSLNNISFQYTNIDGITTTIMPGAFYNVRFMSLELCGNYITANDNAFIYCTINHLNLGGSTYGVNHLTRYMFMSCSFTKDSTDSISFGTAVHTIDDYAFAQLSECPRELRFYGTMSDWNNITKGSNWNTNNYSSTVFDIIHCDDGDITI